jgi:hypothetical protein
MSWVVAADRERRVADRDIIYIYQIKRIEKNFIVEIIIFIRGRTASSAPGPSLALSQWHAERNHRTGGAFELSRFQ